MKNLTKLTAVASLMALTISASAAEVNLKVCAGCHGANFEKSALGKSKIVKDMEEKDIATALKGYKDGTYGGPMKGVMKGQVARYSKEELAAAAAKIKK